LATAPLTSRRLLCAIRWRSLLQTATDRLSRLGIDPMHADIEAHYRWIESVATRSIATLEELAAMGAPAPQVLEYQAKKQHFSDKLDSIFVHKVWGLPRLCRDHGSPVCIDLLAGAPIMDGIGAGMGMLGDYVSGWLPEGPIHDLVKDGNLRGRGNGDRLRPADSRSSSCSWRFSKTAAISLARAFLMDRVLAKVGLHGKSFIPLLSSFACAIPGIMATRTIEDRRSRLATIFVAPFMSCSARLPVYTLLIATFFASSAPPLAAGSCWHYMHWESSPRPELPGSSKAKGPMAAFILNLPSYKLPQLRRWRERST